MSNFPSNQQSFLLHFSWKIMSFRIGGWIIEPFHLFHKMLTLPTSNWRACHLELLFHLHANWKLCSTYSPLNPIVNLSSASAFSCIFICRSITWIWCACLSNCVNGVSYAHSVLQLFLDSMSNVIHLYCVEIIQFYLFRAIVAENHTAMTQTCTDLFSSIVIR